jgi:hypothetical protein
MIPNVCIFLHSHDWHDYMFALFAMPRIDRYKHLKQSSGADQQPTWCQHLVPGPRMTQGLQLCLVFTPKKYSTFIDLWMREKTFMTCQCGLLHVKILTSSRQRIGWPIICHHICHYLSSFEIHCHPLLLRRPFNGSWELQAPRAENVFTRGWQKVFTSYVMTQIEGYAARQQERDDSLYFIVILMSPSATLMQPFRLVQLCSSLSQCDRVLLQRQMGKNWCPICALTALGTAEYDESSREIRWDK